MKYKSFTDFPVWQKAFELLLLIYKTTKEYPLEEKFGLVSDMRRSANSIEHNIAEGFGRQQVKDKCRFYKFYRGSCHELHSQSLVSEALDYIDYKKNAEIIKKINTIVEELNTLIKSLEGKINLNPQPLTLNP